jgi:hypothetical protein
MSVLHTYSALWDEYPDYINFPKSEEVKKMIGGNVNGNWITNTCAIRLSRALNYNGTSVPGNFAGLATVKGGDGKRYAFRVREMDAWLRFALGKPDLEATKKSGAAFDKSSLSGLKGIIGFDIRFSDATGHLDLWDGAQFSSEYKTTQSYFTEATRVWLWKAK